MMTGFLQKNKLYIIGAAVGGIGGWLYYHFIGCTSGTCTITSSPVNSTMYFAMMGSLLGGLFKKETNRKIDNA